MISPGVYRSSMDESIVFLNKAGLLKSTGLKTPGSVSSEFLKECKSNNHVRIHGTAIQHLDYDLLLFDDSIYQFSISTDNIRYYFVSNPFFYRSKEEYLVDLFGEDDWTAMEQADRANLLSECSEDDYEQFLCEQGINTEAKIIRFDANSKGYDPTSHSFAHIHIGNESDFRIPCSRLLTPLSFVVFCTKVMFYANWKEIVSKSSEMMKIVNGAKASCSILPPGQWHTDEKFQLFLS